MKTRSITLPLIILLALALAPASFGLGRRLGEVVEVVGRVTVTRDGETDKLDKGDDVHEGDVIEATRNSSVEISLGTGQRVRIRSNSRVRLATTTSSYDIDTYYGGVLAAINGAADDGAGFRVSSRSASGSVRGTLFAAEVAEDGTTTYQVLHGEVEATQTTTGEAVTLTESTKTVVPVEGALAEPVALTAAEIAALESWAGGLLSLPGVALSGAADGALTTLTEGAQTGAGGAAAGTSAAGGFPWIIVGAVGVVGATAAVVAADLDDDGGDDDDEGGISININWD